MKVRVVPALLGRALRLTWESSPGWTTASITLLLVQAVLALAALALIKLVIDAITGGAASADSTDSLEQAAILIGLAAGVALLNALCISADNAISR